MRQQLPARDCRRALIQASTLGPIGFVVDPGDGSVRIVAAVNHLDAVMRSHGDRHLR